MATHDGHRERMRERIEHGGIEILQDHELLEYLLYSFVPRKNTNDMAHELIDAFGGIMEVFDSSIERLMEIKGISRNIAMFLSSLSSVSRRYIAASSKESNINTSTLGAIIGLMKPVLASLKEEEVHMLMSNSVGKLLRRVKVATGVVDEANFNIRNITDIVLRSKASGVILVHNHPSGEARPSRADEIVTGHICLALASIGVTLSDHVIITSDSYYSFHEEGLLAKIKKATIVLRDGAVKDVLF